jgi:CRISPR-associated protein Csm4
MQDERGYIIWPRSPLRIGIHADDLSLGRAYPSADTLFGAFCWAIRQLEGVAGLERWLDPFVAGDPPLLVTSALPLIQVGGERVCFVPVPVRQPGFAPETLPDRKFLRRSRYIDISLLGWFDGAKEPDAAMPGRVGHVVTTGQRARRLRDTAESVASASPWVDGASRARVAVDRGTGAAALYNAGYAHFALREGVRTGMLVGVGIRDASFMPTLDRAMSLLSEAGIGGERSSGSGAFDIERGECPIPLADTPRGMLLSLCCPTAANVAAGALDPPPGSGYRLVERSGWVSSPDWHGYLSRTVAMLAEGSHVGAALSGPVGELVDVTPDPNDATRHRVYRNGFACFLDEGRLP